jgi:hypothetical protein
MTLSLSKLTCRHIDCDIRAANNEKDLNDVDPEPVVGWGPAISRWDSDIGSLTVQGLSYGSSALVGSQGVVLQSQCRAVKGLITPGTCLTSRKLSLWNFPTT